MAGRSVFVSVFRQTDPAKESRKRCMKEIRKIKDVKHGVERTGEELLSLNV